MVILPALAVLYNKHTSHTTSLADRSTLFIPFISSKFAKVPDNNVDKIILQRMYNKFVVFILILVVLALEILNWQEVIHFMEPDLW